MALGGRESSLGSKRAGAGGGVDEETLGPREMLDVMKKKGYLLEVDGVF